MTILLEADVVQRPKPPPWREGMASLFSSPLNTALTFIAALAIVFCLWHFFRWSVVDAAWSGGPEACKVRAGACWPFVVSNARLMVFGVYPETVLWRPALSLVLLAALIVASMIPAFWSWH
jgi:general L-amino acid transport system permease protein